MIKVLLNRLKSSLKHKVQIRFLLYHLKQQLKSQINLLKHRFKILPDVLHVPWSYNLKHWFSIKWWWSIVKHRTLMRLSRWEDGFIQILLPFNLMLQMTSSTLSTIGIWLSITDVMIILYKKVIDYYFYHIGENDRMTEWKKTLIDRYTSYWPWKKLIECDDLIYNSTTKVFYANMKFIDEPWDFISLICGQSIFVAIPQMIKWLETFESGKQIYAYRK
jgi:hypothetical protein